MSGKLTGASYAELVAGDLAWLDKQPRTLEREHLRAIAEHSVRHECDACERELAARRAVAEAARNFRRQNQMPYPARSIDALIIAEGRIYEALDNLAALDAAKGGEP